MKAHCIMHVSYEGPGCIEEFLLNYNSEITYTKIFEKVQFPEPEDVDFLIVMGGPMSVYEEEKYPWLKAEKTFIKKIIEAEKKVLGICLGSQLIAEVLGAKVYPNKIKEIGWFPVYKTAESEVNTYFGRCMENFMVFHWHGDTYDLPVDALHLIKSHYCKNQAFIYEHRVLGLQFHLEVTPELISVMVKAGKAELEKDVCIQNETEILENLQFTQANNLLMNEILNELLKC